MDEWIRTSVLCASTSISSSCAVGEPTPAAARSTSCKTTLSPTSPRPKYKDASLPTNTPPSPPHTIPHNSHLCLTTPIHLQQPQQPLPRLQNSHHPRIRHPGPPHPQPLLHRHPLHRLPPHFRPWLPLPRRPPRKSPPAPRPLFRPRRPYGLLRPLRPAPSQPNHPRHLHSHDLQKRARRLQCLSLPALDTAPHRAAQLRSLHVQRG